MDRQKILEAVWDHYDVERHLRGPNVALVGWSELANLLGYGEHHTKDVIGPLAVVHPQFQEDQYKLTFVAIPPDGMSIFYPDGDTAEQYLDDLGLPKLRICPPGVRWDWRHLGGPYFKRLVDVGRRYGSELLDEFDIIDGEMLLKDLTRATLVPVCWKPDELMRWERFRKQAVRIKRGNARRSMPMSSSTLIKTPNSCGGGALSYVWRLLDPSNEGERK